MLAALLLAAILAAPIGSALLFLPTRPRSRTTGAWPEIRRLLLAVGGTILLALAALPIYIRGTARAA